MSVGGFPRGYLGANLRNYRDDCINYLMCVLVSLVCEFTDGNGGDGKTCMDRQATRRLASRHLGEETD